MEIGLGNRFDNVSPDLSPGELRGIAQRAAEQGIQLTHATQRNDFLSAPDMLGGEINRTLSCLAAAAALGVRFLRIYAGFKPAAALSASDQKQVVEALDTCNQRAEALGVTLCLETMGVGREDEGITYFEDSLMTDRQWLVSFLKSLPESIQLVFDPANVKAVHGEDPSWMLPIIRDRIAYWHIKDWIPCGTGWKSGAVGDDDLDYGKLFGALSLPGPCLIEYENPEDLEAGIRRSLEHLAGLRLSVERI